MGAGGVWCRERKKTRIFRLFRGILEGRWGVFAAWAGGHFDTCLPLLLALRSFDKFRLVFKNNLSTIWTSFYNESYGFCLLHGRGAWQYNILVGILTTP